MQPFRGTVTGWSLALLALAGCSTSNGRGGQGGTGATAGSSGTNGMAGNPDQGTGGTAGTAVAGTSGAAGTSAGAAGTGGTQATAGTTGSGGGGAAGTSGTVDGAAGSQGTAGQDGGTDGAEGWVSLFNGVDLTGWTPSPGAAALFTVGTLDGSPVIHVYPTQPDQSNQPMATLRTTKPYSSYVYHEEYKWGTKRFSDRSQTPRDNGICFHMCETTGSPNDLNQVWPESIEFQIGATPWAGPGGASGGNIDWVVGNIFMLVNKTRAQWTYKTVSGLDVFSPTGTQKMIGGPASYYRALTDAQRNKDNDWNVLELTVHADKDATYVVNGEVANKVTNMECNVNGTWKPLTGGPIGVQAEFAETYFRNLMIKVLP